MALWCSYGVLWWRYWYLPIYHKILLFCIKWHYQVHCSCFLFIKYSVFIYKKKFKAIFCPLKQQLLVKAQPINMFFIEASNQLFLCKNHFVPNLEIIENVYRLKNIVHHAHFCWSAVPVHILLSEKLKKKIVKKIRKTFSSILLNATYKRWHTLNGVYTIILSDYIKNDVCTVFKGQNLGTDTTWSEGMLFGLCKLKVVVRVPIFKIL